MTTARVMQRLAWALGLTGAIGCAITLGWTVAIGLYVQLAIVYLVFMVTGLLGALIASRAPHNSVGWLMCAGSLAGVLFFLPLDYGYTAQVIERGSWPLGDVALWLESWAWTPLLLYFPLLAVRFPDGRVPTRWRAVDWVTACGVVALAASVALAPAEVLRGFLPMAGGRSYQLVIPFVHNPLGPSVSEDLLGQVRLAAMATIVLGYIAAVASLVARFRSARSVERLQLKWFAYAGVLMAAALVFGALGVILSHGGVGPIVVGQSLGDALIPFTYATLALPLAIGVAILRYRLYDIDLIINRTVVYLSLTAVLYAVYVAVTTYLQRLFVSVSGQKSDSVYVVAAFVVAIAFNPIKDALQRHANRRLGGATASAALDQFSAEVDAVVAVMDVHRVACRLVDRAVAAFDATGGALYLQTINAADPLYCLGHLNGDPVVEVLLRHEGAQFGRLVLGSRRGGVRYTASDRDALQRSANSVGEALALAAHLGHQPLPASQE